MIGVFGSLVLGDGGGELVAVVAGDGLGDGNEEVVGEGGEAWLFVDGLGGVEGDVVVDAGFGGDGMFGGSL